MTDLPTEPTEEDEALFSAVATTLEDITGHWRDGDNARMFEALAPHLAAIRRHAAAQALREQAARYRKQASEHMNRSLPIPLAGTILFEARRLERAAQHIIEEGWAETCAAETPATYIDPAEGCETPVENEGDYCPRHEPADDYDPRDDD